MSPDTESARTRDGTATDGRPGRAVVLVSGGLDSATTLAIARSQGYHCHALSFDYGQRHRIELEAARRVARALGAAEHRLVRIEFADASASALTNPELEVPTTPVEGIPVTYVPARNTVFLAFAIGWAEVLGARDVFIGINAVDYSGYPDCRPEYLAAFERMAALATRAGVEGAPTRLHAPLMRLDKAAIVREGHRLGVDYALTVSCYQPDAEGRACGRCDSCRFRARGFREAGLADPTVYVAG